MLAAIKHLLTASGIDCGVPVAAGRSLYEEEKRSLSAALSSACFAFDAFLAQSAR